MNKIQRIIRNIIKNFIKVIFIKEIIFLHIKVGVIVLLLLNIVYLIFVNYLCTLPEV